MKGWVSKSVADERVMKERIMGGWKSEWVHRSCELVDKYVAD